MDACARNFSARLDFDANGYGDLMDMIFLQVWFAHFVLQLVLHVYSTVEMNGSKNKHAFTWFPIQATFDVFVFAYVRSTKKDIKRFVSHIKDQTK